VSDQRHSLITCLESDKTNLYFIQIPNKFDEETVQRQLRYTGMLETVRIRQAGYNVRLTYDEFIQLYRILLPKGLIRYVLCLLDISYVLVC
jgi:myosin-9